MCWTHDEDISCLHMHRLWTSRGCEQQKVGKNQCRRHTATESKDYDVESFVEPANSKGLFSSIPVHTGAPKKSFRFDLGPAKNTTFFQFSVTVKLLFWALLSIAKSMVVYAEDPFTVCRMCQQKRIQQFLLTGPQFVVEKGAYTYVTQHISWYFICTICHVPSLEPQQAFTACQDFKAILVPLLICSRALHRIWSHPKAWAQPGFGDAGPSQPWPDVTSQKSNDCILWPKI